VAGLGGHRSAWEPAIDDVSPHTLAWETQQPQVLEGQLSGSRPGRPAGSTLVLPLLTGDRTFGVVVLESHVASAFPGETVARVADRLAPLSLPLQTGLVFDEVRELATAEERRRLSREIHDGIAQELASVAYALDTAAQDLEPSHPASDQVNDIRDAVRRLVTELRMSLFDLRSQVAPDEGLGAAIGRHVRAVGAATGLTVHLSLNEGPMRLAAETEAELLRIVQEAVANARRHAQAKNLWVSCTVDPPTASVTIEDDGRGLSGTGSSSSHGLVIMRERAARVRGELVVQPRRPHGTSVQVTIGKVRT
jgi:signal transduction histidine kinase